MQKYLRSDQDTKLTTANVKQNKPSKRITTLIDNITQCIHRLLEPKKIKNDLL
jgi:hypothetical protein